MSVRRLILLHSLVLITVTGKRNAIIVPATPCLSHASELLTSHTDAKMNFNSVPCSFPLYFLRSGLCGFSVISPLVYTLQSPRKTNINKRWIFHYVHFEKNGFRFSKESISNSRFTQLFQRGWRGQWLQKGRESPSSSAVWQGRAS